MSGMKQWRIPVYRPCLRGNERRYLAECISSGWLSSRGPFLGRFERVFARYCGVPYTVAVANGTAALHLALLALGIKRGDEVIIPTLTYVATANAVRYTGATPVLVDVEQDTWNLDVEAARRAVTARTRAVIAVHLYGVPAAVTQLRAALPRRVALIEDAAEAVGTRIGKRPAGSIGDLGCFSFFGNKTITTGEGGMVITRQRRLAERLRRLRDQAADSSRPYWHREVGFNYRMTSLQAAVGLAQCEQLASIIRRKQQIACWYDDALSACARLTLPARPRGTVVVPWLYSILFPTAATCARARRMFARAGIETKPLFVPMHRLPMYRAAARRFPVAERLAGCGLSLPSYPALTRQQVRHIARLAVSAARN